MNAAVEIPAPRPGAAGNSPAPAPAKKIFRVGCESMPFLADHGVHGMIVLPGAFYLELALRSLGETPAAGVIKITGAEFQTPLILAEKDLEIAVELTRIDERHARCAFPSAGEQSADAALCTALEIDGDSGEAIAATHDAIVPETFEEHAEQQIDQGAFYHQLRENGNQYGPCFQGLSYFWRAGNQLLARLSVARTDDAQEFSLNPIVVDSAIQSLMAFGLERNQTFVLRAIDTVLFRRPVELAGNWVTARLRPESATTADQLIGDIEVRDDAGRCWLELRGVKLTTHAPGASAHANSANVTDLVVAATFTAEPIADVFRFWSDTLALPIRVSFAPYAQVFQPLLDPESPFRRNRVGCNIILLNLTDWADQRPVSALPVDRAKAADCFRELAHRRLPNGLEVAELNRHETDYVYREIFEDRCYLRHGIRLPATGTVIDIGANIGLFSLFVRSEAPGVTVLAYEPSPAAFRALKANCEVYGPTLRPFNAGVSDHRGQAVLTCYEKSSVFSTFHANHSEDREAIRAVATNVAREHLPENAEVVDGLVDELLLDRLDAKTIECPIVSVSDIIRDNGVQRVELLKIDAEKCEREILRGIADEHWPLIEQIVVEVHDRTRALLDEVQEILAQHGFQCAVVEETLLTGSGLFNVYGTRARNGAVPRAEENSTEKIARNIQRTANEFMDAFSSFARQSIAPTLLGVAPGDANFCGAELAGKLPPIEEELVRRARELPRVYAVGSSEILARYPAGDFHQPDSRQLGHVPYTADGFAAIGTSVFRMLAALRRRPFKVIALDCDHTLWQGACGEDGALGVRVTAPHRALQEFMIRQRAAGMILCLCSKNHEADVWAVFDQNPAMVLKREHIAAARINWSPKSENLRALATELNLGAESMILLDDNPTECAEVRAHCSPVFVLPLPADPARIPHFLDHVWAFDHFALTAEDRARTQMLVESGHREKFRTQAATLQSFIAGLELQVSVFNPDAEQLGRVAQLTQRTNQFNFSTIRRTESELLRFLEDKTHRCLAVHVSDRFGDYGLVGTLLYEIRDGVFHVDTFLLSCRVLGRGVEHQVLADLGRRALAEGKPAIEFVLRPTEKNQPARDFLATLVNARESGAMAAPPDVCRFAATPLAALRYNPGRTGRGCASASAPKTAPPAIGASASPRPTPPALRPAPEKFEAATNEWDDAHKIAAAVEAQRLRAAGFATPAGNNPLPDTLTGKLLGIWRKTLGNPQLGLDDKFMEAGGTSLAAVQVVAAIRKELGLPLSVVAFFESPTVRLLSEKLSPTEKKDVAADAALARGVRRAQRSGKKNLRLAPTPGPQASL